MDIAPVNPLLAFRESKNWSLDQLARESKVSISTIIRTEQGLYHDIPPVLLRYLSAYVLSPGSVISQYTRFQHGKRLAAYHANRFDRFYRGPLATAMQNEPNENPFILYREINGYKSRLSFCKDLCLHPSTVKRADDGLAQNLPTHITNALQEIQIDTEHLENVYRKWRRDCETNYTNVRQGVTVL